jgi:hypothetical protein
MDGMDVREKVAAIFDIFAVGGIIELEMRE